MKKVSKNITNVRQKGAVKSINNNSKKNNTKTSNTKKSNTKKNNIKTSNTKKNNAKNSIKDKIKGLFSKSYFNKFDDLKIKYKKDPKKALVLIFSIVIAFSILVGSSYAYLTYISKTNNKVTISAGTLALSF